MLSKSTVPLTVKLSSTVTVPPFESIVKLPLVVSISLPLIWTLSIVALPFTSNTPSTVVPSSVVTPTTLKLSSTVTDPPLESIVRLPLSVSISLPFIRILSIKACPVTTRVPVRLVVGRAAVPLEFNNTVPVVSGKVIVRSAVGSVTVKVVSWALSVAPSKTILPVIVCVPSLLKTSLFKTSKFSCNA